MNYQTIELVKTEAVATVWLNRPEVRNAFNEVVIAEMTQVFNALHEDEQVRVVVLAAKGTAFCAGADLHWMKKMSAYSEAENLTDAAALAEMMHAIYRCSKPTIARIQGDCYAGGMGLVAACDIAIAQRAVEFCLSEVRLGLIPATISPYVVRALGARASHRYFLTAERFSATQAQTLGLVHEVVEVDQIDHAVDAMVQTLLTCSPHAIAQAKQLLDAVSGKEINAPLIADTVQRIALSRASEQGREGVQAFLNKRKPTWLNDHS